LCFACSQFDIEAANAHAQKSKDLEKLSFESSNHNLEEEEEKPSSMK